MKNLTTIVSAVILCCLSLQRTAFSLGTAVLPQEGNKLAEMRFAGLHQDRTRLPDLLDALSPSRDNVYKLTALQAVARMGAAEALPKVEALENSNDLMVANFAKAAGARLIAENSVATISDGAAHEKTLLNIFYGTLGQTPPEINAGLARYAADLRTHTQRGESRLVVPVEVYALRQIADIVYQDPYRISMTLPTVSQLNFSLDFPSALKWRLASLAANDRISTLVQELSKKEKLTTNDDYEIQLLADAGLSASPSIAAQLQQMDKDRQQYKGPGFAAMFRALEAIGDQSQSTVISQFSHDADGDVGYFARQVYDNVTGGIKRERMLNY